MPMSELPRLHRSQPPAGTPRPGHTRRPLAELAAGHEGRIADLRLGDDAHLAAGSPLRVGAHVYVVEASGRGWQHVRIGFREYSVPLRVAERIVVDAPPPPPGPPAPAAPSPAAGVTGLPAGPAAVDGLSAAADTYEVLLTRRRRTIWRVLVIHRSGTVVRSLLFDDREAARALWHTLREEAASTTAAEFRARHGLP
jgi:hypothetical protein